MTTTRSHHPPPRACRALVVQDDADGDDDDWTYGYGYYYDDATVCPTDYCDVAHASWLGDGWCDNVGGCYNTAACGYDHGDCCPSTCEDTLYITCGDNNFNCLDPNAQTCAGQVGAASARRAAPRRFVFFFFARGFPSASHAA